MPAVRSSGSAPCESCIARFCGSERLHGACNEPGSNDAIEPTYTWNAFETILNASEAPGAPFCGFNCALLASCSVSHVCINANLVRMQRQCQLAIGFLDVNFLSIFLHRQNLVVIGDLASADLRGDISTYPKPALLSQKGQRTLFTIAACSGVYSRGLDEGSAGVLPFALTDGRVFSLLGFEGPLPPAALDVDAEALPSFFSAWSSLSRATAVDVENSDIDLLQNRNAASISPAASF